MTKKIFKRISAVISALFLVSSTLAPGNLYTENVFASGIISDISQNELTTTNESTSNDELTTTDESALNDELTTTDVSASNDDMNIYTNTAATDTTAVDSDAQTSLSEHISYQTHCQSIGWQDAVADGTMSGTSGKSLRVECLNISLEGVSGNVVYRSYVDGTGWDSWVANGTNSGTTGLKKSITALQVVLQGEASEKYDVYYQLHKASVGWTGWVKNGTSVGTDYLTKRIEAVQILLVPKGEAAPKSISVPDIHSTNPLVYYCAHVSEIGWQEYSYMDGVAGTTGFGKSLEAAKIKPSVSNDNFGIEYSMYVQNKAWQDWVNNDSIAGTTGQALKTYGLKVRLTGYESAYYSIFYRTYTTGSGWGNWVCDGEISGTPATKKVIEAFQVRILKKSEGTPNSSLPITSVTPISLKYRSHIESIGWQDWKNNSEVTGTTGLGKRVEAFSMVLSGISASSLGISYSSHVQSIGWQDWKSNGTISGTTGQAKRVEAVKIKLTGTLADSYDIYYRVHSQKLGWLDWACNGEIAGTTDLSYRIEAMEVIILPKDSAAPGKRDNHYVTKTYNGIDVSRWQGDTIDWTKVAAAGYNFAMVRVQYGTTADTYYKQNLTNASKAGIKTGVYCYSTATTVAEAQAEAKAIVNNIKGYNITYPIAYDIEDAHIQGIYTSLTNTDRTNLILAFKKVIEDSGYKFILYTNANWLQNLLESNRLGNMDIWLAKYVDAISSDNKPLTNSFYDDSKYPILRKLNITMWQYTSKGKINGITGSVDVNFSYKTY